MWVRRFGAVNCPTGLVTETGVEASECTFTCPGGGCTATSEIGDEHCTLSRGSDSGAEGTMPCE